MAYQLTKDENGLVLFGHYPQSKKPADVTITDKPNEFGVCSGSDGHRYLRHDRRNGYFRIEPIRWRVLRERDGKLLLLSDKILDYIPFDEEGTSAYLWSDLCDWLTDDFYYDAFSPEERKHVLPTSIKCDLESATPPGGVVPASVFEQEWAGSVDPLNAETFKAKVFLLSVRNVTTEEFGFRDDPYAQDKARVAHSTDYALVPAFCQRHAGTGILCWWLRSPIPQSIEEAEEIGEIRIVDQGGGCVCAEEVDSPCGVRPAIRIKL